MPNGNPTIQKTLLGVDFYIETYPINGWRVTLTENETGKELYNYQVITDSLHEAVTGAVYRVWEKEIEKTQDYEFPSRVAAALGIKEPECDHEDYRWLDCDDCKVCDEQICTHCGETVNKKGQANATSQNN